MTDAAQLCMGCMEDRGSGPVCQHCGYNDVAPITTPLYLKHRTVLKDQYLVGRMLGHGGFGITYLGWDLTLERKIAIKEYLPSGIASRISGQAQVVAHSGQAEKDFDWGLERFLDEARTLAKFQNHPGIVAVSNFFRENGTAYLMMDYLDGITLDEYLRRKDGRIEFDRAIRIMMPVMDALREVHKANIMHRDISPDNVYLCRSGPVKVLDFGAARYAMSQHSRNLSIILKEGYAPEEQYRTKGNQGPWTDVYAVAATLYRTVTGKRPPSALDRLDIDELERPSAIGIAMPVEAEAALLKALAVRAVDRFQSMEEFEAAIGWPIGAPEPITAFGAREHDSYTAPTSMVVSSLPASDEETRFMKSATVVAAPQPSSSSTAPVPPKKSTPKWIFAVVAILLVGLGAAFFFLRREQPTPSAPVSTVQQTPVTPVPNAPVEIAQSPSTPAQQPPNQQRQPQQKDSALPPAVPEPAPAAQEPASAHAVQLAVAHDHGGGFAESCQGQLIVSGDTVEFRGSPHAFKVKKSEIQEAKMNKSIGRVLGKAFGRGGAVNGQNSFHIRTAAGNFNFVSLGDDHKADAIVILNAIND